MSNVNDKYLYSKEFGKETINGKTDLDDEDEIVWGNATLGSIKTSQLARPIDGSCDIDSLVAKLQGSREIEQSPLEMRTTLPMDYVNDTPLKPNFSNKSYTIYTNDTKDSTETHPFIDPLKLQELLTSLVNKQIAQDEDNSSTNGKENINAAIEKPDSFDFEMDDDFEITPEVEQILSLSGPQTVNSAKHSRVPSSCTSEPPNIQFKKNRERNSVDFDDDDEFWCSAETEMILSQVEQTYLQRLSDATTFKVKDTRLLRKSPHPLKKILGPSHPQFKSFVKKKSVQY